MKDYLSKYAKKVSKHQMGGPVEGAPAPEAGMAPEAAPAGGAPDLEGMLMEFAQSQDPQLAVAICNALLEQLGGGAAPAPAMERGGRMSYNKPMFRKGGKLI